MMLQYNFQNKEVPPSNSVVSERLVLLIGKTCLMIGKKAFLFSILVQMCTLEDYGV